MIVNYSRIPQNINSNKNKINITKKEYSNNQLTFGNAQEVLTLNKGEKLLNFLATNMAWGAILVDLFSMVIPRTAYDFFFRSPQAGLETGRRESMGSINHSLIGVYGTLAGLALSVGINHKFSGSNASKIFADDLTIDKYVHLWESAKNTAQDNPMNNFVEEVLKSYNNKTSAPDNTLVKELIAIIDSDKKPETKVIKSIKEKLIKYYESENAISLEHNNVKSAYNVNNIYDNIISIGKNLKKQVVGDDAKGFFKLVKKMNFRRSIIGMGIGAAVGMATQPINMYLTKKKTGSNAFVGGGEEDDSAKFKIKKTLAAGSFLAGTLATIGKYKDLFKNIQFQGFTPTIKQFKFIYGLTIFTRLLSARNDNELRESLIKDTLGFANWLILGDFVGKLVAKALDKDLLKDGNVFTGRLATRNEVLLSGIEKVAKKAKLRKLSIAQILSYTYSILALGLGVPKLNAYITNRVQQKKNASINNGVQLKTPNDIELVKDNYTHKVA